MVLEYERLIQKHRTNGNQTYADKLRGIKSRQQDNLLIPHSLQLPEADTTVDHLKKSLAQAGYIVAARGLRNFLDNYPEPQISSNSIPSATEQVATSPSLQTSEKPSAPDISDAEEKPTKRHRDKKRNTPEDLKQKIRGLLQDGFTTEMIMKELGVSLRVVSQNRRYVHLKE